MHTITVYSVFAAFCMRGGRPTADPFADSQEERRDQTKVHVRVQQRSGRKCITTVQGLADDLDLKRILKAFKKNFRYVHTFLEN